MDRAPFLIKHLDPSARLLRELSEVTDPDELCLLLDAVIAACMRVHLEHAQIKMDFARKLLGEGFTAFEYAVSEDAGYEAIER